VCDNCENSWGDEKPRDFRMEDLRATLVKHGLDDGTTVGMFAFYTFISHMVSYGGRQGDDDACYEWASNQLVGNGYDRVVARRCTTLYKQGLRVLEEFKKKGIQHQPRK
jgi:hypothetical protein